MFANSDPLQVLAKWSRQAIIITALARDVFQETVLSGIRRRVLLITPYVPIWLVMASFWNITRSHCSQDRLQVLGLS
jgi:hypothetical protein